MKRFTLCAAITLLLTPSLLFSQTTTGGQEDDLQGLLRKLAEGGAKSYVNPIVSGFGTNLNSGSILPGSNENEAAAKAALEKAGINAVVVLRPVGKDKEIVSTPTMYAGPYYGGYWGGYYGYGWGGAWGGGTDIRTNTIVTVETLVYSMKQNKLLWGGQTQTTNPSKVDAFVKEIADTVAKEMKKQGLI